MTKIPINSYFLMIRECAVQNVILMSSEKYPLSAYYSDVDLQLRELGMMHIILGRESEDQVLHIEGKNESRQVADEILRDTRLEVRNGLKDTYVIPLNPGTRNYECWVDLQEYKLLEEKVVLAVHDYILQVQKTAIDEIKESGKRKTSAPTYEMIRRHVNAEVAMMLNLKKDVLPSRKKELGQTIGNYLIESFRHNVIESEPALMVPSVYDSIEKRYTDKSNQALEMQLAEMFSIYNEKNIKAPDPNIYSYGKRGSE